MTTEEREEKGHKQDVGNEKKKNESIIFCSPQHEEIKKKKT